MSLAADAAPARLVQRWPAALGLVVAAILLATGAEVQTVALIVAVAGVCYLSAAALDRPWVAWAAIPAASLVIVASKLAGVPWWAGLGLTALALIVAGGVLRVPRAPLTAQTAALLAFAGFALAGLFIAPRVGLAVAGLALASHALWDVIHYRRRIIVPRSLSEACMFLDTPLGIGAVILAITG